MAGWVGSRVFDVAAVDRAGWESRVGEVAVSRTDRVTVVDWWCVQGLERRGVVWLTERRRVWPGVDPYHWMFGPTRCTTQLVTVSPPPPPPPSQSHTHHPQHQHPT